MENWGMPEEVNTAIRYQKNPAFDGEHHAYAKALWLGRQLLTEKGIALGAGESIPDAVFDELGLNRAKVDERFEDLVQSKDSVMAIAGMMNQGT